MDRLVEERDRRWAAARDIMRDHGIDALIAVSDYGDQNGLARYLANFRSSYDTMAVMLHADEGCDLVLTHAGGIPIARQISWATDVLPRAVPDAGLGHNLAKGPTVGGQLVNRLAARGARRIGVAGAEYFPSGWKDLFEAVLPRLELVDVGTQILRLRLIKSAAEQALIREASRISDLAWSAMPEFVRVGRKRYEVLADVEHVLRLEGCEDSFNLCMSLPMLQETLDRNPYSALPIEGGHPYLIEVSPRYLGYFGQQTGIVATGPMPDEMRRAYEAVNRAREDALALVRPGNDLADVGHAIAARLRKDGFEPASASFGHAVGLELEDWHIDGSSCLLEEGMTFIFHPMVAGHPAVMRADTYLVTATGVERLTSGDTAPLVVG